MDAYWSLRFARGNFEEARRILSKGIGVNHVCDEIKNGILSVMAYWLRLRGDKRFYAASDLEERFRELAKGDPAEGLLRCLSQAAALDYELQGSSMDIGGSPENFDLDAWKLEVARCLNEAEGILDAIAWKEASRRRQGKRPEENGRNEG